MGKVSKPKKDKKDERSFVAFLKKRAPLYGILLTAFLVFAAFELSQSSLEDRLPSLEGNEAVAFDILKSYDGPNDEGLRLIDAISNQFSSNYPDEKIWDKDARVDLSLSEKELLGEGIYEVNLEIETYKETIQYIWNVNINSGEITALNQEAKSILDIVDYYD